jgi:nitrate reductase assembly molybdenum cofactor insertion protein NarJ
MNPEVLVEVMEIAFWQFDECDPDFLPAYLSYLEFLFEEEDTHVLRARYLILHIQMLLDRKKSKYLLDSSISL